MSENLIEDERGLYYEGIYKESYKEWHGIKYPVQQFSNDSKVLINY